MAEVLKAAAEAEAAAGVEAIDQDGHGEAEEESADANGDDYGDGEDMLGGADDDFGDARDENGEYVPHEPRVATAAETSTGQMNGLPMPQVMIAQCEFEMFGIRGLLTGF